MKVISGGYRAIKINDEVINLMNFHGAWDYPENEVVDINNLRDHQKECVLDNIEAYEMRKKIKKAEAQREAEKEEFAAKVRWTAIYGHSKYCGKYRGIYYLDTSKKGGWIVNILEGYHDITPDGKEKKVKHCQSLEELIKLIGGDLVDCTIYTKYPARLIGSGGSTIKFLSKLAGKRLQVEPV